MNDRSRGIAEMTVAMSLSGTIGWFVLMSRLPVIDVVFWRCVFGLLALLLICGFRGLLRRGAITRWQAFLAALGGVAVVLNWLLLFGAYSRSSISVATTVYNTQPFMLVALGAFLLRERPTADKLLWLLMSFGGVLVLVRATPGSGGDAPQYLLGIVMALGAAFFYALAAITAKKLTGVTPLLIVLIQVCVGTAMLAPMADLVNPPVGLTAWGCVAVLGIVHTGIVFVLLYSAIQRLPTHLTGALSFIYPLVAILVDMLAFGHRLEPLQLVGAAAILAAAAATTLGWAPIARRRERSAPV